jgi:hypothetical protein
MLVRRLGVAHSALSGNARHAIARFGFASRSIAMKPAPFDYATQIDLLVSNPETFVIAGGQSLILVLAFRLATPSLLVDLRRLPGLGNCRRR